MRRFRGSHTSRTGRRSGEVQRSSSQHDHLARPPRAGPRQGSGRRPPTPRHRHRASWRSSGPAGSAVRRAVACQTACSPRRDRTGLRYSRQERNFFLQRQNAELASFAMISRAETALVKKNGAHVFDIAELSRVSLDQYNLRVWMVGATGIEPVTPSMSTRCSPAELRALRPT